MTEHVISFYQFVAIDDPEALSQEHLAFGRARGILGGFIFSPEGVNATLAGEAPALEDYIAFLHADERFRDVKIKWSRANRRSFRRLIRKIKPELIRFDLGGELALEDIVSGPRVSPEEFRAALDQDDVVIVDTRNNYETEYGSFRRAELMPIDTFVDFKDSFLSRFGEAKDKKYYFFCTGGIRCEKAVPWAMKQGFQNVFQLDGGILGYFERMGGDGYDGDCFVFDQRWIVNPNLEEADPRPDDYNLKLQPKPLA